MVAEPVVVKLGVVNGDGEVVFRRVDLSRHGGGFGSSSEGGKVLFLMLKLYAIQSYLGTEGLPDEDTAFNLYKVTLYYTDMEGDKMLVGSVEELKEALHYFLLTKQQQQFVAKVMAMVVPIDPKSFPSIASTDSATQTVISNISSQEEPDPPTPPPAACRATSILHGSIPHPFESVAVRMSVPVAAAVAATNQPAAPAQSAAPAQQASTTSGSMEITLPVSSRPEEEKEAVDSALAVAEQEPSSPADPPTPSVTSPLPFIHGRHSCDVCLTTPIVGVRYHAMDRDDYDLCAACYANYQGNRSFQEQQLERDVPCQERWQRRLAKGASLSGPRAGGGGGRRRDNRYPRFLSSLLNGGAGGPSHSPSLMEAPPSREVADVALKEAIRSSLQGVEGTKDVKEGKTDIGNEELLLQPTMEAVSEAAEEPPEPEVSDVQDKDGTMSAASCAVATAEDVDIQAGATTFFENDVAPADELLVVEQEKNPAALVDEVASIDKAVAPVEPSLEVLDSFSSPSTESAAAGTKSVSSVDLAAAAGGDVIDSNFSSDVVGNGLVAAAPGEGMDTIAASIDEVVEVNDRNSKPSFMIEDNKKVEYIITVNDKDGSLDDEKSGAEIIIDGEENQKDDLSSIGSWDEVDDPFASGAALARAALVVGSSLLKEDMAHSTEIAAPSENNPSAMAIVATSLVSPPEDNNKVPSGTEPVVTDEAASLEPTAAPATAPAPAQDPSPASSSSPPFIHARHTCDMCLANPIVGLRYHSLDIPDYDLCAACFGNYQGELRFEAEELERDVSFQDRWNRERAKSVPSSRAPPPSPPAPLVKRPFVHARHTCDNCRTSPIIGARYHSLDVPDYDLCAGCFGNYQGELRFEQVELARDLPFQDKWHRVHMKSSGSNSGKS